MALTTSEQRALLRLARRAIAAALAGRPLNAPPAEAGVDWERFPEGGAFVTLHRGRLLRGCIGLMESPYSLPLTVMKMAAAAALEDSRFPAVEQAELPELTIEISVLSVLRRVTQPEEIVMGRDGVLVKRGGRSGVFLPQVAEETGWDRERFMEELCVHKAGLPPQAWREAQTEVYVFTAEIFHEKGAAES